jgi:hypothetical protein
VVWHRRQHVAITIEDHHDRAAAEPTAGSPAGRHASTFTSNGSRHLNDELKAP